MTDEQIRAQLAVLDESLELCKSEGSGELYIRIPYDALETEQWFDLGVIVGHAAVSYLMLDEVEGKELTGYTNIWLEGML